MQVKLKYCVNFPYDDNLIIARGLIPDKIKNPSINDLQSPKSLDNIILAGQKTKENLGEKAAIIVDSDYDGYASSAILINYFKLIKPDWKLDFFIHENKGHGISDLVESVNFNNYKIVFIPDAGSNDDVYFSMFKDTIFIVLDHHMRDIAENFPDNMILVNSQLSANYLNKSISGAGVTWQFTRYLDELFNVKYSESFIDLAATSIISDLMDISTPENMYIVKEGIKNINNIFLRCLIDAASFKIGSDITPISIAFYVAPMVNAMCRVGSLPEKQRMFLAMTDPHLQVECKKRGVEKGTMIDVVTESLRECTNAKNRQKRLQEQMADLCNIQIIENDLLKNKILIIILDERFDKIPSELNGVTAGKLVEETGHPTLIGRLSNEGVIKGSIRGSTNLDMPGLKTFLQRSGFFTYLAGHENAAGFELPYKKMNDFIKWANNNLSYLDLDEKLWEVDFSIHGDDLSSLEEKIYAMDSLKDSWGVGFPEALFSIHKIPVNRYEVSVIGKNCDTVKIEKNGISFMFFKCDQEKIKKLTEQPSFLLNIVGTANINKYYNKTTPQIFVKDFEVENYKKITDF